MSGRRVALLVGCSQYTDPEFSQLPSPARDVDALQRVLANPEIGDFSVDKPLLNHPSHEVQEKVAEFFAARNRNDLLLLYFSCHGDLDSGGQLYFAAKNTTRGLLSATGISAQWVKQQMDQSRSKRIVLLLDCCYSGAFTRSPQGRSADVEKILKEQLGVKGRVVITASGKMEYAYNSEFTDAVVRGLATGEADRDGDGKVEVWELYQYVRDRVQQKRQDQTPTMSANDISGELYLANNPHAPLPDELKPLLSSDHVWLRSLGIEGLRRLAVGDHAEEQKRAASKVLTLPRYQHTDSGVPVVVGKALPRLSSPPDVTESPPVSVPLSLTLRTVLAAVALIALIVPPAIAEIVATGPDRPAIAVPPPIASCSPQIKPADGVLKFGTLLPKSGQFLYSGPAQDAGAQLAVKDINKAGGIPGILVNLDVTNQRDEGNPFAGTASQSTDSLLGNGVDAIIGPSTSAAAVKVIDKVVCAGVIMFAPGNTSPLFTHYPDHGLYFRTAPLSTLEGAVLGKLVVDDRNSTAVVMSRDDPYGNDLRAATVTAIKRAGGQVLDSFPYDPNALDHDKDIQRVKAKDPDAIVLIGFTESAQILVKMIEEGLGPRSKRLYGPGANMTNTLANQVSPRDPSVLAGMRGTPLDTGGEEFVKRLQEAYPGLRDLTYAPQAYDAVVVTALAAAVAHTDEPAAVAREINGVTKVGEKCISFAACMTLVHAGKNIDYDGPSGPLEFTDPGEPTSATYVISEIQADGTVKPLRTEKIGREWR